MPQDGDHDHDHDATTTPPPTGQLASSLEEATSSSLLYVDRRGQVQSPERYRRASTLHFAGTTLFIGGANVLMWLMGGAPGLVVGGTLTLLLARQLLATRRLQRAMALLAAGELDASEALLRRVERTLLLPPHIKGRVDHGRARLATLRGHHDEALALQESALRLLERGSVGRSTRRTVAYSRVVTLVNLDRPADARRELQAMPPMMEGDYLRFQRATADLYVALAEGRHDLGAAYLREQADIALSTRVGRALLGLLAWAHASAGDRAAAAHLLATAREQPGRALVSKIYPRLAAWMDGQP